jgi:hypothetical protein
MEWNEPKLPFVGTYLTWHNFLLFSKKIFEEVFCVARLALKCKKIPLITITPTIKDQILRSLASQKALLIPYLP